MTEAYFALLLSEFDKGSQDKKKQKYKIVKYCTLLPLKTSFNIVEAPFKKLLNFDVCVVWC